MLRVEDALELDGMLEVESTTEDVGELEANEVWGPCVELVELE